MPSWWVATGLSPNRRHPISYSVDQKKSKTREAWIPSRRSATWWQLHKTRGFPALNPTVTPVDESAFSGWGAVVNAARVDAEGQPIALDAQLRDEAAERRVEVQWTEKVFGVTLRRRALIELREPHTHTP